MSAVFLRPSGLATAATGANEKVESETAPNISQEITRFDMLIPFLQQFRFPSSVLSSGLLLVERSDDRRLDPSAGSHHFGWMTGQQPVGRHGSSRVETSGSPVTAQV